MNDPTLRVFGGSSGAAPRRELTVKEYAAVERVTERTVWNWIDKSAIVTRRTPGGGVRVVVTEKY
jgi:hypothetical protein